METTKKKQATLKDSNYFQPNTYLGKFKQEFTGRGIANILVTTILAPLERWRVIAQTQQAYPSNPKKFNNFFDFIAKSPKQQGISSLWRGNYSSIWIYLYQTVFQIGVYDSIKEMAKDIEPELGDSQILKFISNDIFFPLYSSLITTTIIHPVDTYRIQRTMSYHQNQGDALVAKFRWRRSQIGRGLYHGFWMANIIGLIQFNLYRNLSSVVEGNAKGDSILEVLTPSTILSVLAVGLVHPLDTLKKIYQLNNQHKPQLFRSYREVMKYIQENKSVSILYNGFLASITKAAIMTPVYLLILNGLNEGKGQRN